MKMKKAPAALVELFAEVAPGAPAEQRKMFGYPCSFLNGNLFMGLHGDRMILRLPEEQRNDLIRTNGAKAFEPMPGRPMREYIVVPKAILDDRKALTKWIERSRTFAASLKIKPKKAKKAAKKR
jgi:TfoX/Sxy family transcriptional regulator of competence genes